MVKLVVECMSDELKSYLKSKGVDLPRIPTCPRGETIRFSGGVKKKPSKYNEFMGECVKRKRAENPGMPVTEIFKLCAKEYKAIH